MGVEGSNFALTDNELYFFSSWNRIFYTLIFRTDYASRKSTD